MTTANASLLQAARAFLSGQSLTPAAQAALAAVTDDLDGWCERIAPPSAFQPIAPGCSGPDPIPGYPDAALYWHTPEAYHPDRPCRLFLFMHGGDTDTPNTAPLDNYIGPKAVMHPFLKNLPVIVAAPSAPPAPNGKRWNHPGAVDYLEAILDAATRKFNIDRERIIIGGHSMGGFGAYHLGQLLTDKAAALWLSAGAWKLSDFRSLLGTAVYISHAKYDCAYAYRGAHKCPRHHDWRGTSFARAAHQLMLRDQVDHVYDEHDGGHGLFWEPAQMSLQRFLNWALLQKRQPFASRTALVTPRGTADPDLPERPFSRWLSIDRALPGEIAFDRINLTGPNVAWTIDELAAQSFFLDQQKRPGARLIAAIDGANHFAVTTENVAAFSIWLHPEMVDLNQPVTVNCNGRVLTAQPQPSLLTRLEGMRLRRDPASPYVAKISFDLEKP